MWVPNLSRLSIGVRPTQPNDTRAQLQKELNPGYVDGFFDRVRRHRRPAPGQELVHWREQRRIAAIDPSFWEEHEEKVEAAKRYLSDKSYKTDFHKTKQLLLRIAEAMNLDHSVEYQELQDSKTRSHINNLILFIDAVLNDHTS